MFPTFLAPGTSFMEDNFYMDWPQWGEDFGMIQVHYNFPGGTVGKESTCQCRRHKRCRFNPWDGKKPWRRKWKHTPVFLPGKFHRQRSLAVYSLWGSQSWTKLCKHTHKHIVFIVQFISIMTTSAAPQIIRH